MLKLGGYINIGIALAHIIGLLWAEQFFESTGAGNGMQELSEIHYSIPYLLTVFVAIVFFIFGVYGLSAANVYKKLPFLKFGIFSIAAIYIFRGIGEFLFRFIQNITTASETIQSIVALFIGLLFLLGGFKKWHTKES